MMSSNIETGVTPMETDESIVQLGVSVCRRLINQSSQPSAFSAPTHRNGNRLDHDCRVASQSFGPGNGRAPRQSVGGPQQQSARFNVTIAR